MTLTSDRRRLMHSSGLIEQIKLETNHFVYLLLKMNFSILNCIFRYQFDLFELLTPSLEPLDDNQINCTKLHHFICIYDNLEILTI